ncbi:hypothetical protein KSP39_PZI006563 [Platanthera zijinensis]|uniref:Uncharacterized protein n=1 Tax=Platanthera zijinensis TaxID=2320716 RepID=A0AAP0BQJ4_9ASPA
MFQIFPPYSKERFIFWCSCYSIILTDFSLLISLFMVIKTSHSCSFPFVDLKKIYFFEPNEFLICVCGDKSMKKKPRLLLRHQTSDVGLLISQSFVNCPHLKDPFSQGRASPSVRPLTLLPLSSTLVREAFGDPQHQLGHAFKEAKYQISAPPLRISFSRSCYLCYFYCYSLSYFNSIMLQRSS